MHRKSPSALLLGGLVTLALLAFGCNGAAALAYVPACARMRSK